MERAQKSLSRISSGTFRLKNFQECTYNILEKILEMERADLTMIFYLFIFFCSKLSALSKYLQTATLPYFLRRMKGV